METIYTIAIKKAAHFKRLSIKNGNHQLDVKLSATELVPLKLPILNIVQNIHIDQKNKNDHISTYNKLVIALFNFSGFHILVIS